MNNSFITTLQEFREGHSIHELSEEFSKVIQAVRQTGKGGTLVYKIKVKPASKGRALQVTDDISSKIPQLPREAYRLDSASAGILKTILEKRLPQLSPQDRTKLFDALHKQITPPLPLDPV